jgi:hypothetical protein
MTNAIKVLLQRQSGFLQLESTLVNNKYTCNNHEVYFTKKFNQVPPEVTLERFVRLYWIVIQLVT